jgi:hypothetical protein
MPVPSGGGGRESHMAIGGIRFIGGFVSLRGFVPNGGKKPFDKSATDPMVARSSEFQKLKADR